MNKKRWDVMGFDDVQKNKPYWVREKYFWEKTKRISRTRFRFLMANTFELENNNSNKNFEL